MPLTVGGFQMDVTRDVSANTRAILSAIEQAADQGAEILLTPEGSVSGYTHQFDQSKVEPALDMVTTLAKDRGIGLALGTCYFEDDRECYNQIRFYDKTGVYLGFHSKILRCGSMEKNPRGEINHYAMTDLRTFDFHGLTIGGLICNDFWANPGCTPMPDPHLVHQHAQKGTSVIFQAVNGGRNGSEWARDVVWPFHESNLRLRTQRARTWTVIADSAHPLDKPCSCPSGVVDPDGQWAARAPDRGEHTFVCQIDLGQG